MHTHIRRMGQRNCIFAALRQELMNDMFREKVGGAESSNYQVDLDVQSFAMVSNRGEVTAKAHLLASVAAKPPTLLWGYSEMLSQYADATRLARKVYDYGVEHHEEELTTEEVPYTLPLGEDQGMVIANVAHDIGSAAITIFGDDYYCYSSPIGGGSRAVLLLENLSEDVPPITLKYLYPRLSRYLQQVDDVFWSLEGLVERMPGWRLDLENGDDGTPLVRITDETGASLSGQLPDQPAGR